MNESERRSPSVEPPLLSVIVPVCDGRRVLQRCLEALQASDLPRALWEVVVVDDGSLDGTALLAAGWADVVVRLPGPPRGPAYARNRGVDASIGAVLVFLDPDVAVHPDTLRRIAWAFARRPELGAVFGSYDARPTEKNLVSQYRTLRYHFVHHQEAGPAETFWAACGAVRRDAFAEAGRFDEWHFPRPQIEDIELGYRLRGLGFAIELDPSIQGTHLKRWSVRDGVLADLAERAVPWIRLQLALGTTGRPATLLFRRGEWISSAVVVVATLLLLAAAIAGRRELAALAVAVYGMVLFAHRRLYGFLAERRGIAFAFRVMPLHLFHYLLYAVASVWAWLVYQLVGAPAPPAEIQAYAEKGLKAWPPLPSKAEGTSWAGSRALRGPD